MEQESRKAAKGDFVKIHFRCTLKDGTIYDASEGKEPLQFIIGRGEVLPFLEEAAIGMLENETKTIHVKAEQVFGLYANDKAQVISRDQFPKDLIPQVGLQFQIHQSDGQTSCITITDVTESNVTLTPAHPLAGQDLTFDVELLALEKSEKFKAEELFKQGIAFQDTGHIEDAIACYQKAIDFYPKFAEAFYNLGVIYQQKDMIDKAILYYEIAIGLNQELVESHHNLGVAYKEKGEFDEAIFCFQRVLQLKPDHADAFYNLGNTLVAKGQFHEALQSYQKAVEINPDFADAHWSIALIKLRSGNFKEGWKGYEWRWKMKDVMLERNFPGPLWDGSDIQGKTIVLYAEQGFGDTIHFIRYAPEVSARGARVIVECQSTLTSLIKNVEGVCQVFTPTEHLPAFDVHCPLLSLPSIFGTTLQTIPHTIPYIKADPHLIEKWRNQLAPNSSRFKIGLVWSGDPRPKFGHSRSCHLDIFSPLVRFDNTVLFSLQKGAAADQAKNPPEGMQIIDYTDELHDFSDTAAFIENLDLVISVDTAVAHLTGALGKPVWTLLPFIPDWRWMMDREDSPWYPTMRLFRQSAPGDWKSVLSAVENALSIVLYNAKKKT